MNIVILGRGAWGRAMADVIRRRGHEVELVGHDATAWPAKKADAIFLALPVQNVRETLARFPSPHAPVLSMSKGLDIETGRRVSELVTAAWGESRVAALSGPTFAGEIAAGLPAICTIAAEDEALARQFQEIIHQPSLRAYTSGDLIGVELGGAYAIAGGACRGLKLGQNALAGLLTRCLAEMTRIGAQSGARAETFAGPSGIGDLMLSATSEQSRNFRYGQMLALGLKADEILPRLGGVCEGVPTTRAVHLNSAIPADAKPIVTQLHAVLYEGMPIADAVRNLLSRIARDE
jgi:glycerol-3-phosphate dehydrogenase (NAD(P)+)